MIYEIFYDFTDDGGYENRNIHEVFEGSWSELQDCIKSMKQNGCYNIDAVAIDCE